MKKIVMWLMSTLTVLMLLFGYHTSTSSAAAAAGGNTSAATPYSGSTTASSSCPSLNTSAVTRTGSPTARLTGCLPQSICGCTFSITVLPMRPAIRPPPAAREPSLPRAGTMWAFPRLR